jgi:hypothetical protein
MSIMWHGFGIDLSAVVAMRRTRRDTEVSESLPLSGSLFQNAPMTRAILGQISSIKKRDLLNANHDVIDSFVLSRTKLGSSKSIIITPLSSSLISTPFFSPLLPLSLSTSEVNGRLIFHCR